MPRKNQRRKNVNSQSSAQRKAKPIKFNPNDLEVEQNRHLDIESIENDAIDMQSELEITTIHKINSKQGNTSDNVTTADDLTEKCHSMEQNDTVQEVAVIEIPVINTPSSNHSNEHPVTTTNNDIPRTESNSSFVQSNEPNERIRMENANTEWLRATNMNDHFVANADILMGNKIENIQNECNNDSVTDNNANNSQTECSPMKMTETINDTNNDDIINDINRVYNVASEINVLVPERDAINDKNMIQKDDTLHAIDQIEFDPVCGTDNLAVDNIANIESDRNEGCTTQNTPYSADHLIAKQEEQAKFFQNNSNDIEIDQQSNFAQRSNEETKINIGNNASALKPETLQINRTEVIHESLKTDTITDSSQKLKSDSSANQSYHVKSPELKEKFKNPIRKNRSLDDSTEFNIQELSDCGSSAAENITPHISEAESDLESDSCDAIELNQSSNNRLISIETCPLNQSEIIETEKRTKCENPINVTANTDAECKKQIRLTSYFNGQYLQPLNGLQAISEENSDTSDIEQGNVIENQDKSNETDSNKTNANVSLPKSKYDFSHFGRTYTNLQSPKTEVIREEPQCILVDAKIVEPENVAEGNRTWTTTMASNINHAELIYLDSSSSNTSLSDIESVAGNDGDIEDINSDYDVRIETPIIGTNFNSAFTPINKKSPGPVNSPSDRLKCMLEPCDNIQTNEHTEIKTKYIDKKQNDQHESVSSSIENTFKPINENDCSIRTLLENIANASTPSSPFSEDNTEIEPNNMLAKKYLISDSINSKHEPNQNEIETENQNKIQLDQTKPNEQQQQQQQQPHQQNTNNTQHYSPHLKIIEPCTSHMFPSIDTNFVQTFNLCDSSTVNNSEFNRQESVSSHCSSHTESTSHSQCTAQYIASETSPNEFIDFHDGHIINLKTLGQLCTERVAALPYGHLILEELEKYSKELPISDMPYPPPKLPCITDLEIHSELMRQPKVPPRTYQSNIKFVPNFLVKSSPSPPPVPNRPWLGLPIAENPNVLVCLSPAQRELYQEGDHNGRYNSRPDQLLDMHNKFVDRRGYYEYTDDEVNAINSQKSVTSLNQAAETDAFPNMNAKDDNKLLALIREINQLTNSHSISTDENSLMTQQRSGHTKSERQKHIDDNLPQKQSDRTPINMDSNATATPNSFHSKRFSHYFDDLNRLHTISEEIPKSYSNYQTKTFESYERIKNDKIVHDYSDSSDEKITNTNNNNQTSENIQCASDLSAAKQSNDGEFYNKKNQCESTPKQYGENEFYRKFNESKNSRETNSQKSSQILTKTSNIDDNESLNKSATATTVNEEKIQESSNRFSFKDFDFVPKILTNLFRSNKTESTTNSEQMVSISNDDCVISDKIKRSSPLSISSDLRKGEEHNLSTQSLYDWYSGDRPERSPSRNNLTLNVGSAPSRGRISPNPIRAPRIVDPPKNNNNIININTANNQNNLPAVPRRHYDWNDMKQNRNFECRQSMIDQTPITRLSMMNSRRCSLPKVIADSQLASIIERENQMTNEFDKLEMDRMRLMKELEEMQVNQSFEDFYKAHKKRNSLNPNFDHLSEGEMLRKQMQDEWLSKVAEREERRLQKIIKVTHSSCEMDTQTTKSLTNRGLCDEFLERVKERRSKLQIPSDSDWESGAESQPIQRNDQPIQLKPNVKVIDGGHEADLNKLPKHIQEFAELTAEQIAHANQIVEKKPTAPFDNVDKPKDIIHQIERCDNMEGIWSPSGTPQPTRREFTSTEKSHGTPTVERREFRSVKFESPTLPRKIYTPQINTTHSASTQSLPSISGPPPTPPKLKEHQQYPSLESVSGSTKIRSYYPAGVRQINDASYSHNEYVAKRQHLENERNKNMDRRADGIDVKSKSEANEGNQHDWYKKMYNTIHKVNDGDGYVTVRYKTRKGQYPYKSSNNGYASEPERGHDSDYSIKYKTLDRRRIPSSENVYATLPNPIKPENSCYKNHPGKIENFTPGHSSATDKDRREEQFKLKNDIHKVCEGNLSRALKDQGYESDSTLVFRKRENSQLAPLSPVEQKQAYLNLQAGGEAPLQGFRKPAPEKPKEQIDIEYLPITSTLTKIRVHNKGLFLPPIRNEIICYPITSVTKPIDLFAPFPKQSQSFVPTMPPHPPQRVSSKGIATLKVGLPKNSDQGRSDQLQCESSFCQPQNEFKSEINDSKPRHQNSLPLSSRSRSTSSITTSFTSLKDEKNYANHSRAAKQCVQRVSSLSPISRKIENRNQNVSPIAFGRSISKERTFAEERRKQEECLPLCKRAWTASTNILRDPFVQSPNEVREAVRNTYQSPQTKERFTATTFTRKTPIGNTIKTSTVTYAKDKLSKDSIKNDEKMVRMTVVTKPKSPVSAPVVVKSNMSRTSVSTETKMSPRSKETTKTSSNISLARTNSTYSIDSSSSRRRIRNRPVTIKSTAKATAPPVTILSKPRKKKNTEPRNVSLTKKSIARKNVERSIEVSTRTVSPARNGHERSNSFIMIKDEHKARKQIANPNSDSGAAHIRSDAHFQNLFRQSDGDISPSSKALYQNTANKKGTQFWNTIPRRAHYTNRRPQSFYLAQKQAVTGSKFKTLERENARQARSLSPRRDAAKPPRSIHFDRVSKFDSFHRLSDEDEKEEFECSGFNYKYEKRSKSEPRSISYVNKIRIDNEKRSIEMPTCAEERPFSPTREIRSPSSRRIQSFRLHNRPEAHQTQDFNAHRRYHSLDSRLAKRRSCCVDGDNYVNHSDICSHGRLEKFKDLNRFYAKVERVGQLERATSTIDLHPIRKENDRIDFDIWKRVRDYERAEREMESLVCKLKKDEKEKDFLFRPKYAEDVKWDPNMESGLRVKEKSVEDLREIFIAKSLEAAFDDIKRNRIESGKERYKSLWNGYSILDLASNMAVKYSSMEKLKKDEKRIGISNNLMSTLSRDQVSKIKNQLTEIYGNNGKIMQKAPREEYVINVSDEHNIRPTSLIVRSNSLVGEKDLLKPVLQRQQNRFENRTKAGSIGSVHETRMTRSVDRYDSIVRRQVQTYTEEEKKKLLQQLGNEIREKLNERRVKIVSPRETRGAIAVENTNIPTSSSNKTTVSIKRTEQNSMGSSAMNTDASQNMKIQAKFNKNEPFSYTGDTPKIIGKHSKSKPVKAIAEPQSEKIKEKIEYFEHKKDEKAAKTIYLPRDDSSLDEEEIIRAVSEKVEARRQQRNENERENAPKSHFRASGLSSSVSDMKELFGEKESVRNLIEFRSPSAKELDDPSKIEPEQFFRSRSISPISNSMHSTLKKPFRDIEIHQYESATYKPMRSHSIFAITPRRYKSDSTLNEIKTIYRNQCPSKVIVKGHEAGDVSHIMHKFELKKEQEAALAARSRSRVRRNISPIQRVAFKDPLMPHIDIISKTAALKDAISRNSITRTTTETIDVCSGEVEKIRHKFECQTSPERISLIGQMYTSSPNVNEIKDISNYLSSTWIAHKYSKPDDNARSATEPEKGPPNHEVKRKKTKRSNSISPPRINAMLKPLYDIFADQNYDPMKHRPTHRYIPVDKRIEAEYLWRRLKQQNIGNLKNAKESARRYIEGDVNIHYKTPVRYELKDPISDAELVHRQEQMKKLYQEERRRKYLQELQDLNNRRHGDNFTPSQKSPIPLNRFDDFDYEYSLKSTNYPRIVARALYNFQGQTARELSFKKGDTFYIRREIDKNWYEGEHNATVGLLPANYVEIVSKDGVRYPTKKPTEGQARAKFNFQAQSAIELSLNKGELVVLTRRVDDNWFEGRIANRKGIFPVSYVEVLTDIGVDLPIVPSKPIGSPAAHSIITSSNYQLSPQSNYSTDVTTTTTNISSNGQHSPVVRETSKSIQKTEVLHVDTNSEPIPYRAIYKYRPQNTDELELQEGDTVFVLEKCDDGWFVGTSQRTGYFGTFPGNYVERI